MTDFAITPEGVEIPTVEDLLTRASDELRGEVDPTLDTSAESPEGQMDGIVFSHLREAYEALQELADISPRDAENQWLDTVASLTGTRRDGATKTRFVGTRAIQVNLNAGVTLAAGAVATVEDHPDTRVVTLADATNSGGIPAWIDVDAEAEEAGPIAINADTLTVIATPTAGWNAVNNPSDGVTGRLEENDTELRAKRERELRKPGGAGGDAIEVDLESIEIEGSKPVLEASVFRNTTMLIDARGLPPKSIEALIWDGEGQDCPNNVIAQSLWGNVAGGIQTFGNMFGVAIDRKGGLHQVFFSRPAILEITVQIEIVYSARTYVGDEQFKILLATALKAMARSEMLLRWSKVSDLADDIAGVAGIESVQVHTSVDPMTNFQLPLRTFPMFDSSQILVSSTLE